MKEGNSWDTLIVCFPVQNHFNLITNSFLFQSINKVNENPTTGISVYNMKKYQFIEISFADDINMLAENEKNFQSSLNHLEEVMLEYKIRIKLMKYVKEKTIGEE